MSQSSWCVTAAAPQCFWGPMRTMPVAQEATTVASQYVVEGEAARCSYDDVASRHSDDFGGLHRRLGCSFAEVWRRLRRGADGTCATTLARANPWRWMWRQNGSALCPFWRAVVALMDCDSSVSRRWWALRLVRSGDVVRSISGNPEPNVGSSTILWWGIVVVDPEAAADVRRRKVVEMLSQVERCSEPPRLMSSAVVFVARRSCCWTKMRERHLVVGDSSASSMICRISCPRNLDESAI
jgi:hypothetical protein